MRGWSGERAEAEARPAGGASLMRTIELAGPDVASLSATARTDPDKPARGEAIVRMRAAAFNYLDLLVATGRYPGALFPNAPVADGAGEVVAIGEDVDGVSVGDRVAVHPKAVWISGKGTARAARVMRGVTTTGSLVEYAVCDAGTLVKAPPGFSFEEIACLPIPAATGWNGLRSADVGPAATVVLTGTGVTALQTLQLARASGARIIVTSSSDEKLAHAVALGADHGINYRTNPDWENEVLALTDGNGADLVFDSAGAETFSHSLGALGQGGTLFTIGFVSGAATSLNLLTVISKSLRIVGYNTGSAADLRMAMAVIARHELKPVVAETFSVHDLEAAYAALAGGGHFGKLAIPLDW